MKKEIRMIVFTVTWIGLTSLSLITSNKGQQSAKQVEVTFISNCGFILQVQDKKILFDPEDPSTAYKRQEVSEAYELMKADKPPFNDIDVIFISHAHDDHLAVKELTEYLKNNPGVKLFSNAGVRDSFRENDPVSFSTIEKNIVVIDPGSEGIKELTIEGMRVTFLGLLHAGAPNYVYDDLCFAIEFDGYDIFYLSDISPDYERNREILKKWVGQGRMTDLLFSPDVNLYTNEWSTDGFKTIMEVFNPARLIAMHVDPLKADYAEKKASENFPGTQVFRQCLETRIFK